MLSLDEPARDDMPSAFSASFLSLFDPYEADALEHAGRIFLRTVQDAAVVRAMSGMPELGDEPLQLSLPEARRRIACVAEAFQSLRGVLIRIPGRLELPPEAERFERMESGDLTPPLDLAIALESLILDALDRLIAELFELGQGAESGP